jgi:hypothetical protein
MERLSPFRGTETRTSTYSDTVFYELSHFAKMLAKCNPTAVETVFARHATGDQALMDLMLNAALDTELYVKQCNGFIHGMIKTATPKSLHHAARVHTHLTNYVNYGILEFNAATYVNYFELMKIKRGELPLDKRYREPVQLTKTWDIQNRTELERIVVAEYMEDAREL